MRFEDGAVGTIEASRFCQGRKNHFTWEINGSKGSLAFDLERLNELEHSEGNAGFRTVLVSEADHPFWEHWWPQGHMIGWEHSFVHELHHLLTAIRDDTDVAPHGATLEDGYRAAEVCDAMLRSAEQGGARDRDLPELMHADRPADRHAGHEGRRATRSCARGCAARASTCSWPTPGRRGRRTGCEPDIGAAEVAARGRRRPGVADRPRQRGRDDGGGGRGARAPAPRRGPDRRRARRGRLGQHGDRHGGDARAARSACRS